MALYVKYPKTCRNKKQSVVLLTPPDSSSLSSSSGSLSSSNSERKTSQHKKKLLYANGHPTIIAVPKRKKLRAKKLPTTFKSDDCECVRPKNNNSFDVTNLNALYSLCKSSSQFLCAIIF